MVDIYEYLITELYHRYIKAYSAVVGVIYIVKTVWLLTLAAYRGFKIFIWPLIRKLDLVQLYGEYVIITSVAQGIGLEFAKQFLKRGHSVVIIGANDEQLNHVKDDLRKYVQDGKAVITITLDHTNHDFTAYKNISKQLDAIKSNIGILVNNATVLVSKQDDYLDYNDEHIVNTVRAHIISVLMTAKAVLPFMVHNKRGLILNVTSPTSYRPMSTSGFHDGTKEFVDFFGKTLRAQYSKENITIQTLNPGYVQNSGADGADEKCCFCFQCFHPTPERFVSSAISAIGRSEQTCGYWAHALMAVVLRFVPNWLHSAIYWLYNRIGLGGSDINNENGEPDQELNDTQWLVSD